ASIAQVHAAQLRSGEEVVVKVQRPQVARLVREDLAVMAWVAPRLVGRIPVAALANPPALVELFAEPVAEELDFRLEAENMPDARTALLDFGLTGRLDEFRRRAFLRLLVGATVNDVKGQMAALRDLGTLPPDTDLDAVIADLGLDRPPVDPTTLTPDELVAEIQRTVKGLLGYGARLPKELMLFVKNLACLDGALANFAPYLPLFAAVAHISTSLAAAHGA